MASNKENLARERNLSDKYGSIREFGTEERIKRKKGEAIKDMAYGAALSPLTITAETLAGEIPKEKPTPMGGAADYLRTRGRAAAKALKDTKEFIGDAASKYKATKEQEEDLDRELESQMKRETRGMKKGGAVKSASARADGIAQRGKTRGMMR